nr:uncharacterized protein LOC125967488 isoform X2 [Syngnathus scovelli]
MYKRQPPSTTGIPENTENSNTMPPIVITVLLLSFAAVSPVSANGNGKKEKEESVSGKIEKANAHVRPGDDGNSWRWSGDRAGEDNDSARVSSSQVTVIPLTGGRGPVAGGTST